MSLSSKQFLNMLVAGQKREPSLFDWRGQLEFADEIIARVGAPVRNTSSNLRPSRPTDLTPHREAIAKFLAELQEAYIVASHDFEMRNDPNRPERKPRKKDIARYGVAVEPLGEVYAEFDYTEFDDAPDQTWEEHWDEVYARPRGNPGQSRLGGPPVAPLYVVVSRVRRWWQSQDMGAFTPIFNCEATEGEGYQEAAYNGPLRFLLAVVQTLDPAYTIENVRSVLDSRGKGRKAQKSE